LVLLVVVPEEILFRGGLAVLIDAVHPVAFVVASAVLFGLIHFPFGTRTCSSRWSTVRFSRSYS
jgi:membrane protease YdiL (CAAX protease family)